MPARDSHSKYPGETLLDRANAEPDHVLRQGRVSLVELDEAAHLERALTLRAMSIAARILGRHEEAIEHASEAKTEAEDADDAEQQLLAVLTMVGPLVSLGRLGDALDLVDGAGHLATTPYLQARWSYQRGNVLDFNGDLADAVAAYTFALPSFRDAADDPMVRSTLQNLGSLHIVTGDLELAEAELTEALALAQSRDELPAISGIEHNLGLLASYHGDVPRALRLLQDSDDIYMKVTGAAAPQHVARCDVLMSAGLFREARALAVAIAGANRRSGDLGHLCDALVVSARAALLTGQIEEAVRESREAMGSAQSQGRPVLASDAHRILVEARFRSEGASLALMTEAGDVADSLETDGLVVAAAQANLLTGQIALDIGDEIVAIDRLARVARVQNGPVELRIQAKLARALTRLAVRDRRGASSAARSGLRLVDEYQAALGASDLRSGLERHSEQLGAIGLDLALHAKRPRRILEWMEMTRARALRHQPVVPATNDAVGAALARLRQVDRELRRPESRGDRRLSQERLRLQNEIRDADRTKGSSDRDGRRFDLSWLFESLGERDLFEMAFHRGRLVAVLVRAGRVTQHDIGPAEPIFGELAHLRFALRRSARKGRVFDPVSLDRLDRLLLATLPAGDRDLVIVPPPDVITAPWGALPSIRSRSLTISPSAEIWWRTSLREPGPGDVVVAGGPDLEIADDEVRRVSALYPDAHVLPPGCSVEAVRSRIGGASVAHIACHATFQVENPMFSSLRLGDGDLNVYDIERLDSPPGIVILSACDSGYTESRAGDELTGLTSALLSMGTRTVIASVGLVPDSGTTVDLMVDLHKGLSGGLEPARALANAQAEALDDPSRFISAASFICVGA